MWKDKVAVFDTRDSSLEELLNVLKVGVDKLLAGRADAACERALFDRDGVLAGVECAVRDVAEFIQPTCVVR